MEARMVFSHSLQATYLSARLSLNGSYPLYFLKDRSRRTLRTRSVSCSQEDSTREASTSTSSSSNSESTQSDSGSSSSSIPWLIPALSAIGATETAYLSVEKILGGSVFCFSSESFSSCGGVLNSPWATLYGIPVSFFGFIAYSAVFILSQKKVSEESAAKWATLCLTTSMVSVSAYLMYILATKFEGTTCLYCLSSAALSAGLWLTALRSFELRELQTVTVTQTGLFAAVIVALSVGFSDVRLAYAGVNGADYLPPISPEVVTQSSPEAISLAQRLQEAGAKMYGAFWCSHCNGQKQTFGKQAMEYINYVECYPEGYRRGIELAKACVEADVPGFPTWVINGIAYPGELDFKQLADAIERQPEDFASN